MTREELELLREGWDFEAKKAAGKDGKGALPDSLWETYSAFANTQGGCILLGATERKDGSLELHGVGDVAKVEKDLWNLLQSPQKVSANILARADVGRLELDGKQLLLVRVPQAPRAQRPIHLNGSIEQGTFIRVHEGDRRASAEVARRMLADRYPDRDAQPATEFALGDLHAESVARYRALFGSVRPAHPFLTKSEPEFLEAIGAATADAQGVLRPTWAGMWMLGDEIKLRRHLPHWHLSYKELPLEPDDRQRWTDRVAPDGTWNANLFEFYMKVNPKILGALKVPFALDHAQSRIDETEAHHALREALVNTLVHADHRGTTGIRISKTARGFEFINPGLLLIEASQLWKGGVSEARNPALQRLFSTIQQGEREGSGGPTMQRAWAAQHFRRPRIWLDAAHSDTHLLLPLESLLPEWATKEASARFGDHYEQQNELGRLAIVTALVEGEVSHFRVQELSGAHSRDVTLKLQDLMRRGLLASKGPARSKSYFIPGGSAQGAAYDASSGASGGSSEPYDASSGASGGSSGANGDSSHAYDASSEPYDASSEPYDASSAVLRVRQSKRASTDLMRAAILELCQGRFLTADLLAAWLKRSRNTLRNLHLPKLLADELLEPRYPASATHPQQAYRSKQEPDA